MTTESENAPTVDRKPSYIAFKTFLTAVETFEQGLPPMLDRSVWPTFSGGLQSHTLNAFKFLGLIDENGKVQEILEKLVNAKGENRKDVIKEIINGKYKEAVKLGSVNASFQQLQDHFRSFGVQGGTLEMVVRFFLDACKFTGIKYSPLWASAKKTSRRGKKEEPPAPGDGKVIPPTPPGAIAGQAKANIQTIQLKSGGTVSLSVDIDLISLSQEDREWIFKIIDQFKEYGKNKSE